MECGFAHTAKNRFGKELTKANTAFVAARSCFGQLGGEHYNHVDHASPLASG